MDFNFNSRLWLIFRFGIFLYFFLLLPNNVLSAHKSTKIVPENDMAKIFTIETAIKFSDGGHVMMLDDVDFDNNVSLKKWNKMPIEEVLKYANGIQGVVYEAYIEEEKKDFVEKVRATGRLHFSEKIEKILIPKKKGGFQMEMVDFGIDADSRMTIRELVEKLEPIDWRWSILHGYENQKNHLFEVGFSGHFTLILSENVEIQEGIHEPQEIGRFHFTPLGLRIFRKSKGNKDFTIGANLSETEAPSSAITNADNRRGLYRKFPFPKALTTRRISMTTLKQIGLNIVGHRPFDNEEFDCRAWGYLFTLAIVPKKRAEELRAGMGNWPVNVGLEEEQFEGMGVPSMFKKYVPQFDYKKWVKENAKAEINDDGHMDLEKLHHDGDE